MTLGGAVAAGQTGSDSIQQFFAIRNLKLQSGQTIPECRIGFRTFGTLNADESNAILFPTWFTGTSAALAGSFGPGKLIDTSRFFVIAVDALANGVSCSPTNVASSFPQVTIADMVHTQYRLVTEHFRLRHLYAVAGISMGGMQTFEWMVSYPGFFDRAVPIIGSPKLTSTDLLLWHAQLTAIEDAQKQGVDPRMVMPAVAAMHNFALFTPEYRARKTPAEEFESFKTDLNAAVARDLDPRDRACQLRAMMSQDVFRNFGGSMEKAGASVRARVLVIVATQDHMVNPIPALDWARVAGFQVLKLDGDCGHMATSCESGRVSEAVGNFLKP